MAIRWLMLLFVLFFLTAGLQGQAIPQRFFEEVSLRIDTSLYTLSENQIQVHGEPHLYFKYQEENPVVEIRLYPASRRIDSLRLVNGEGFDIIDSLININEEYYRLKLRLKEVTRTDFLMLAFRLKRNGAFTAEYLYELRLFPTTETIVFLPEQPNELFIGEEKTIPLEINNPDNIRLPRVWTTGLPINYRFSRKGGRIFIHLMPNQLGEQSVQTQLKARKPFLNEEEQPVYEAGPINKVFTVKPAKLAFLNINKREVSLSDSARREGIEIELSYDNKLQMQKTYRLEAREEAGGPLMAEIFTRNVLANGRVLCWLRLYNYHRRSEGYLYIKDGDEAQFITNLDIIEETDIQRISLRREGKDWEEGSVVYPGETVDIKLEGLSLHRANFRFDGLVGVHRDSIISNDKEIAFTGKVPIDIAQRQIHIYNGPERTSQPLRVREYERARPFDFIIIDYGEDSVRADEANLLIFVEENLNEITLRFDNNKIDEGRLNGRQELEMSLQVLDNKNSILDQRDIRNIIVCPGQDSPRFNVYSEEGCQRTNIKINEYLRKKTFELDIWTTIRLKISHKQEKYGKRALSKTIEFVLYRPSTFDIDVSFPAGLVVKRLQEPGFGNLGGISMAMIAQFSFYKDKKVAKAKPYKFGAGFLAFNAFNFSENNNNRDIGVVVLASLYPLPSKDRSRLSFPLFAGGGYFLSESRWFLLFGPGIRVRL